MTENPLTPNAQTPSHRATAQTAGTGSTTEAAKTEATDVAQVTAESAGHVAATVKDETAHVASEVGSQAKDLLTQMRTELGDQADTQQQRLAGGLRSVADELHSMVESSEQSGMASDLVRQGADRSASAASWLEGRDSAALLEEVRGFARQRPVAFLALAAGVGILAGRLTRGLSAGTPSKGATNSAAPDNSAAPVPVVPVVPVSPAPVVPVSPAPVVPVSPVPASMPVQPYGSGDVYAEPTLAPGEPPISTTALPGTPGYLAPATEPLPDNGRY
ncbi:hypothetical protein IV500_17055 [Paeniglutamicibacter antarcticus]|uniref:Uncharacterized protein n=1 Tax=Arthrobacter terrae TaxID=2935737 RepID=A0A931CUB5_9MICC|nr:hypothetical protein [Arthrobacter terrae]MBG0741084.1 hypothetical protein [Arthrobacter terrae]